MKQQWSDSGVRLERSGWRDKDISLRHRDWGFNCPAADLDFVMVEYNVGKPVGIVEYKHFKAKPPNINHPTYRALNEMANISRLPFLIAFYWPGIWAFKVWPVNEIAKKNFKINETFTEKEFVLRLYRLRRLVLSDLLLKSLNDILPKDMESVGMPCQAS